MKTTTKKYSNPPLLEALCEFVFDDTGAAVQKIKSDFYNAVSKDLPQIKEKKDIRFIIKQKSSEVKETQGLVQFINEKGNMMAQVGNKTFAVNYLKPYANWEEFEPFILRMLDIYLNISSHRSLSKITVRYINKIDIPANSLDTEDYFKLGIVIPEGISQDISNFVLRTEHNYNEGRDLLQLNLHMTPVDQPQMFSFIFDTSYILTKPNHNSIKEIPNWLENAHANLNMAFESSLTEKCKTLFE